MTEELVKWSGSLRFTPGRIERPTSEEELSRIVRRAAAEEKTVRPIGSMHTSSPIFVTDDILVSLAHLRGVASYDPGQSEATVLPGTPLHVLGDALHAHGLAVPNLGDIDVQQVAGAIATGTHGTGRSMQSLSCMLVGGRLLTAAGEIMAFSIEEDPEFVRAVRVSLGTLGIFTALRLRLLSAYDLRRREWCTTIDRCCLHLEDLIAENRNFDFYWYPRSDTVKLRTWNRPGEGPDDIPYATLVEDRTGPAHRMLSKSRSLKFHEMEYALPAKTGYECFERVRTAVLEKHRRNVGWRVLYRTVAPDDSCLSVASGRPTVTISLHQNATLPFWDYFRDIEPIFVEYGGRPHWAKKHTLKADDLRPLYPEWDRFRKIRRQMDPGGVFMTPPLYDLLEGGE
jgi:FAD/FMN-containing dehydrogenase